jgi:biopolymer transport protein ExbB
LSELESELSRVRAEYQQAARELDGRTVELTRLTGDIRAAQDESAYLSSLLGEYARNFETRLHIAEMARYADVLAAAKLAPENGALSREDVYRAQSALVTAALERLHDALGGARYDGRAVDVNRMVAQGTFVLVGPTAVFRSADGAVIGTVEQRLGSPEPSIVAFESPDDALAAERLVLTSAGHFPLDPSLGDAHKIASTEETLVEHIRKGGAVMVPILVLAGAALLVVLFKWVSMLFVRNPSRARLAALLDAIARGDRQGARREAQAMRGPAGQMLAVGVEHLGEPRELLEELMFERVLSTRLKLQRWLPFVAISASSAPLLGLLGTVTGIMNTFKLITVFGTGDVKTLSSGISEALITTEFGLIVAIPSLLLHAFLARKAKSVVDEMEKAALAFLNQVGKTPMEAPLELSPVGPSSLAAGKAELAAARR